MTKSELWLSAYMEAFKKDNYFCDARHCAVIADDIVKNALAYLEDGQPEVAATPAEPAEPEKWVAPELVESKESTTQPDRRNMSFSECLNSLRPNGKGIMCSDLFPEKNEPSQAMKKHGEEVGKELLFPKLVAHKTNAVYCAEVRSL